IIVRRGHEADSLNALASSLASQNVAVWLNHLPPSSMAARLAGRLAEDGWMVCERPAGRCPVIPLAAHSWDTYLETLGAAHRATAVTYVFADHNRFYFYQHGFDEGYSQHSVGLVLMGLTIQAAIEEGAFEFDMLWGNEPYKSLWAREERGLRQLHMFPPHLGG